MVYDRLPLPKGIMLKSGNIHADGWCGPKFEIQAAAAPTARCLKISLFNPDFSRIFLDNGLTVSLNDDTSQIDGIQPDQQVHLFLHIDADEKLRARVTIAKTIPPSAFDSRERSMKLLSMDWVEAKPEEDETELTKPTTALPDLAEHEVGD